MSDHPESSSSRKGSYGHSPIYTGHFSERLEIYFPLVESVSNHSPPGYTCLFLQGPGLLSSAAFAPTRSWKARVCLSAPTSRNLQRASLELRGIPVGSGEWELSHTLVHYWIPGRHLNF